MTDPISLRLESLSTAELRRLHANLQDRERARLLKLVRKELKARGAQPPGVDADDEAPEEESASPRRTLVRVLSLAAALAIAIAIALFGLVPGRDSEPRVANQRAVPEAPATAPNRAMVALAPPEPVRPEATAAKAAPGPDRGRPPRLAERPDISPRPPATIDVAQAPVPEPVLPPPSAPLPSPAAAPRPSGVLAVSRAPVLAAVECAGAEGAGRLLCDDARRAALIGRQPRGAPVPVRIAIAPAGGRALAAPAASGAPR